MTRTYFVVYSVALLTATTIAQWSPDPAVNTPVCTAPDMQVGIAITTDGESGCIVGWLDSRSSPFGPTVSLYAQRINYAGIAQWTANGVPLCTTAVGDPRPAIVSDGAGGAIIVWMDLRPGSAGIDLYAQRINNSGVIQWTANGVPICTAADAQIEPAIVADGSGGAIITWVDNRTSGSHVYAQRINSAGLVQWVENGVAVATTPVDDDMRPVIMSDGKGGAIIVWADFRNANNDIFAQRINGLGVVQWPAGGVAITTAAEHQHSPVAASDGAAGAIIAWTDLRNNADFGDVYVQRVDSTGAVRWLPNGLAVCGLPGRQDRPAIVEDNGGGAIMIWEDNREGEFKTDIYAQRVNHAGFVQWTANGIPISTEGSEQLEPRIVSDGAGGAMIAWVDFRGVDGPTIFTQRVSQSGIPLLLIDGVPVSTSPSAQFEPVLVNSGVGRAIVAWEDSRNGPSDIYCDIVAPIVTIQRVHPIACCNYKFPVLGLDVLFNKINPPSAEFDLKVVQYFHAPPDRRFDKARIESISQKQFWTINALNLPVETTFQADLSFVFDPLAAFGDHPPVPLRVRVATRKGSSIPYKLPTHAIKTPVQANKVTLQKVTQFSEWVLAVVPLSELEIPMERRWNMVSLPLLVSDNRKEVVYPTANSSAFAYHGMYVVRDSLETGVGYWLRFDTEQTVQLTGTDIQSLVVDVNPGWNMIGSISEPIAAGEITSDPPGMITSSFFGYQGGYRRSDTIYPGKAYWVKVSQAGQLALAPSSEGLRSHRISITPIYDLPPPPPDDLTSNPDPQIPKEFVLEQNYPNPFNPSTSFRFHLPRHSFISLKIYDLLGQVVATLVHEERAPGTYEVLWDASDVPSGVYYCGMNTGSLGLVRNLLIVK